MCILVIQASECIWKQLYTLPIEANSTQKIVNILEDYEYVVTLKKATRMILQEKEKTLPYRKGIFFL